MAIFRLSSAAAKPGMSSDNAAARKAVRIAGRAMMSSSCCERRKPMVSTARLSSMLAANSGETQQPMSGLKIYGIARTRAFRALWMAKELGLDYEHDPVENGEAGARTMKLID